MKILLSEKEIESIVERLAREINKDYGAAPVLAVGILKGSFVFMADLVRKFNFSVEIDFIQVASYAGTNSTGKLVFSKNLVVDIAGRNVLIIEDIIDTGTTLSLLKAELLNRSPKSLKIVTLLDKPSRRKVPFRGDYVGKEIPNEFVVGYGIDYNERYRNLPYVGVYEEKNN